MRPGAERASRKSTVGRSATAYPTSSTYANPVASRTSADSRLTGRLAADPGELAGEVPRPVETEVGIAGLLEGPGPAVAADAEVALLKRVDVGEGARERAVEAVDDPLGESRAVEPRGRRPGSSRHG